MTRDGGGAAQVLPANVLAALYGFALCFLGGMFPTLIAAVECFKISGWDSTYPHLVELWRHHKALAAANLEDDKKDDDRDGIADVKQITPEQLVQRKTLLFLRVADPEKVRETAMSRCAVVARFWTLRWCPCCGYEKWKHVMYRSSRGGYERAQSMVLRCALWVENLKLYPHHAHLPIFHTCWWLGVLSTD